jgi:hypothetical protein
MWLQVFQTHIQPGLSLVEKLSALGDFDEKAKEQYKADRASLEAWSKKATADIKNLVKAVCLRLSKAVKLRC